MNSVIVRFSAVMLLALIMSFILILVLTTGRVSQIEKENANQYLSSNLRTVASTMDQVLKNLEGQHTFIYMDNQFLNALRQLAPYDSREEYSDYKNTNSIKNRIGNAAVTNDYIYSIYTYSVTAQRFFSSKINWESDFNHFSGGHWLETYRENRTGRPWQITREVKEEKTILACYREVWTYGVDAPIAILSVNVDAADIAIMLREIVPKKEGYAFFIDERGNIISENDPRRFEGIIPRILTADAEGYFSISDSGQNVLVSYYRSPYSKFIFAAAAPLDQIRTGKPLLLQLIMVFVAVLFLAVLTTVILARHYFWAPIRVLFAGMKQVEEGGFSVRLPPDPTYEFGYINDNFNRMAQNIQKLIEENYASKLVSKEVQLKNIQNQLNEHFLYNTLDSIHWLARRENAVQASEMVYALANFYRTSLSSGHDIIPVRDAVEMTKNYLYIQKIRMRDTLGYTIFYDPDLADVEILKGLLQPLVENALIHGMKALDYPGKLRVIFKKNPAGSMRVSVLDNGRGFSTEQLRRVREQLDSPDLYWDHSFALKTIQSQLRLYYGVKNVVNIETGAGNTTVWFEIPLEEKEGCHD
jgi:two-component system sensor histidine kinase YesM